MTLDSWFDDDPVARRLVREYRGPVPLRRIGEAYGTSRQSIMRVERSALAKLRQSPAGLRLLAAHQERRPTLWDEIGLLETAAGCSTLQMLGKG